MNYFFSAIVIESGPRDPIQLVSLAIVDEGEHEYYAESSEYNLLLASEGQRSIIPGSVDQIYPRSLATIASEVQSFVGHRFPSFWSYNGAQEFTALYQLYDELPDTWPRYYHELQVELKRDGDPRPPGMDDIARDHHALSNARWIRDTYLWLIDRRKARSDTAFE